MRLHTPPLGLMILCLGFVTGCQSDTPPDPAQLAVELAGASRTEVRNMLGEPAQAQGLLLDFDPDLPKVERERLYAQTTGEIWEYDGFNIRFNLNGEVIEVREVRKQAGETARSR